jgi:hypothetical protein
MMGMIENALLWASKEADVYKVTETKTNSSPRIDQYLKLAGGSPGMPWCAAFVTWCLYNAGIQLRHLPKKPKTLSACSYLEWARSIHIATESIEHVQRGDLFCWCNARKWQGHIGFVVEKKKVFGMWFIRTIEGNSNDQGQREGIRVQRRGRQGDSDATVKATWRKVKPDFRFILLNQVPDIENWKY